jgi:enoyl-[acyl-carrier protein] reductase I
MGFLNDRKILITGLLSSRSIAYGVAQACKREGATLAFTYVNDDLHERVRKLAAEFGSTPVLRCEVAHDVSSYSLAALAKGARPLMQQRHAAIVTLTYLGAVRAVPNYNVMGLAKASLEANVRYLAQCLGPEGIRVNGISAGPIKTLAAAGIAGFSKLLHFVEKTAPLRRNVTPAEVGNAAAFLLSDLSSAITGEVSYVDCGFSTVAAGMADE